MHRNIEILMKWVEEREDFIDLRHELAQLPFKIPSNANGVNAKIQLANTPFEMDTKQFGEACALFYILCGPEKFIKIYNQFIDNLNKEVDLRIDRVDDVLDNCKVTIKPVS